MPSYDEALLNVRRQLMTTLAGWTITLNPAPGMPGSSPQHSLLWPLDRVRENHQE
jgi:hypothetical protein